MHAVESDRWLLNWDVRELFKRACNESLYIADRIKEYSGSDDLNMGDTDFDVFLDFYKLAANNVWNELNYLCVGKSDCYLADEYTLTYTLYTRGNDPNTLPTLDGAICDYIISVVLSKWFGLKGVSTEEMKYEGKSEIAFNKIRNCKNRFLSRTRRIIDVIL